MAFQYPEHQIFEQTVFDEVAYGARRLGVSGTDLEERVAWALGLVGMELQSVRARNPLTLSGGEMRRVALAGILVRQPEVLLLDEPTANLDPAGRRSLLAGLAEWQARAAATLVVVSHRLEDLARISDRAILLAGGEIVADLPSAQLLSSTQVLGRVGFRVPRSVELLGELRDHGWCVRVDRLLPSSAAAEIAHAARSRRGVA
jgi:energy-coupling factor transport system ATP-binding protein